MGKLIPRSIMTGNGKSLKTFSWTPAIGQTGTYPDIQFSVSDGELSHTISITIMVTETEEHNGGIDWWLWLIGGCVIITIAIIIIQKRCRYRTNMWYKRPARRRR